jgi:hypothetical protein
MHSGIVLRTLFFTSNNGVVLRLVMLKIQPLSSLLFKLDASLYGLMLRDYTM